MNSGRGGGGVCNQWRDTGRCGRGSSCKFRHVGSGGRGSGRGGRGSGGRGRGGGGRGGGGSGRGGGGGSGRGGGGICHEWQRTGSCRFGTSCKYQHVGQSAPQARGNSGKKLQASNKDVSRFVQHLAATPVHRLGDELLKSSDLWRRCWQNHGALDGPTRRRMLEVLAKTPGSSSVDPPPIQFLEQATCQFLDQETKSGVPDDKVLDVVKTTLDAVVRALQFDWLESRDEVKAGLSKIILDAEAKLRKQHKDHRDVAPRLMEALEDMEKPWRIKVKELSGEARGTDVTSEEPSTYEAWQRATVKWLCDPTVFAPSRCPTMKVGTSGVYDSTQDYMDTVHRLWVAMTFSDGHAALAPHCRARGQSGSCGNALWPVSESAGRRASGLNCRTRDCQRHVEFSCRVKNHDSLCAPCAARSIGHHLGGPGKSASTHVYDCKVKNIDSDGVIYLTGFESRSPPPSVHWRTTKRLSAPNLVAVVRLQSRGFALNDTDVINWGEITFHGHSRDEDKRRQNGELAVNLSSIVDHFDPDFFGEGGHVAVIDCMSFVPEWVPVLRALDNQKQTRLPFDNGRYLNLCRDDPATTSNSVLAESSPDLVYGRDRTCLIEEMIEKSSLEPIRQVRLDPRLKVELVAKLENLVLGATLDKMQLVSFIDALRNPVHLTQGPPGTGKSYLGVVLVRALIIVRDLWLKSSSSTGVSPILVLSYKNHAIDEFLVDLVASEPGLTRNKLIRIGGMCKDQRLAAFSERSAYHTDTEVKLSRSQMDRLNQLRDSLQATLDVQVSSFRSFFHLMFSGDADDQSRRVAANESTGVLMECIARRRLLRKVMEESKDDQACLPSTVIANFDFLALKDDRKSSGQVQRLVSSNDGSNFIAGIIEGVSHYHEDEHWGDVLLKWLCGNVPLPCCVFTDSTETCCRKLSVSPDVPLCDKHRCSYDSAESERCCSPCKSEQAPFCTGHGCKAGDCPYGRMEDPQVFCRVHACRKCVDLGLVSDHAIDAPPRNVCEDHPLCLFPMCPQFCPEDGNYCRDHSVVKCTATTKKGKLCKGKPLSRLRPYCQDHRHLAGSAFQVEDVDPDEVVRGRPIESSRRCSMIKKKGRQCKGTCLAGLKYCSDHNFGTQSSAALRDETSIPLLASKEQDPTTNNAANSLEVRSDNAPSVDAKMKSSCDQVDSPGVDTAVCSSAPDIDSDSVVSTMSAETKGAALPEPDELELEDEAENLQHLRDVFEVDDGDESDSGSEVSVGSDSQGNEALSRHENQDMIGTLTSLSSEPNEWNWELSLEDRWGACEALMDDLRHLLGTVLREMKHAISLSREDLKQAKIRAKAKVYENKSIIGGTMVGCISRLPAIRKTRPFAVVIEEASEVLEPLLFACLSESTIKLEMIGDHRQLQPSLMSRFDFELCNKVNVSMFQRLIEAPESHAVPSTVLSVQRRMRKNICDLTRTFYADVTAIEDHEICGVKTIGDGSKTASAPNGLVRTSATSGREVPGIGPHVFLWTHSGVQQRAQVGCSRINSQEAQMACQLVGYLVECGVPRTSIAVLTPYKGQLMLMRNLMFKDSRLSSLRLLSRDPSQTDVCRMSTVDRFQGDEEDIVICSLVVDENSRTPFVKLQNRMIVLLSRARLGLYVLGNTGYFESNGVPSHWAKTFDLLQAPATSDSTASLDVFTGERTGPELPLCCPVHRSVTTTAAAPNALRLGFCSEACTHSLTCGHSCSLRCHWPKTMHNQRCTVKLESPCQRHPGILACHQAFLRARNAPPSTEHTGILAYYKCPNKVDISLQCSHAIQRPCWEDRRISAGEQSMPDCDETSPIPYTFPSCGHTRAVTCSELVRFNENPALVRCENDEVFEPACGHPKPMKCFKKTRITDGVEASVCEKSVSVTLPRCGHQHMVKCRVAQQITGWVGDACEEIGIVQEGQSYGPQDYPCQRRVALVRKCAHQQMLPCGQAFAQLKSMQPCGHLVPAQHPSCGHSCRLTCTRAAELRDQDVSIPQAVNELQERSIPPRVPFPGIPPCSEMIKLNRKCGHVDLVACSEAGKPQVRCQESVTVPSSLCAHPLSTSCGLRIELGRDIWQTGVFAPLVATNRIARGAEPCRSLSTLSTLAQKALRSCTKQTSLVLRCGHEKVVECSSLLTIFSKGDCENVKCEEQVNVILQCGHIVNMKCFESGRYNGGDLKRSCSAKKSQKCWNFATCQITLEVACSFDEVVACCEDSNWTCAANKHSYEVKLCSRGQPLDCPGCSLARLSGSILSPPEFSGEQDLRRMVEGLVPEDRVTWIAAPLSDYIANERDLLSLYRERVCVQELWSRPVFSRHRIPCFRILNKKNRKIDRFDPKKFPGGAKAMFGMMTKMFRGSTLLNLSSTSEQESFTLLVGYASVAKTRVLQPDELPSQQVAKNALVCGLLDEGYDSLVFVDEKGLENLIVWDPFPLIALCRLRLSKEQLRDLGLTLNDTIPPNLAPELIRQQAPPSQAIVCSALSIAPKEGDGDNDSAEDLRVEESASRLIGSQLEGLIVDVDWLGGVSSGGLLPSQVEKTLLTKMEFANADVSPFAAIQMLRSLQKQIDSAFLGLLMAAEMLEHSLEDARESFSLYLDQCASAHERLHPWALIVAARLDKQSSQQLLKAYVEFFPTQSKYLSDAEKKQVSGDNDEGEVVAESAYDELLQKWADVKAAYPGEVDSDATEKLLRLTGLKKVKEEVIMIWKSALLMKRMDDETRKENLPTANYCFLGNPGTGKTTVARLFAQILCDSGIRQRNTIVETTAQKAKDGGTDEFKKSTSDAMQGVLFIDEAYDLDPVGDFKGKPIVNELLTLCENDRDKISVILAGYEDDFNKKFFAYNDGLRSRFRLLLFDDFDEKELAEVWTAMRSKKKWEEENGVCSVVVKRMMRLSGRKGFGNARSARSYLEAASQSALARLGENFSMDAMTLEIQDVIGEDPRLKNEKLQRVVAEINEKIGWSRVKERVDELINLCGTNYQRELLGKPIFEVFLNRMFIGNPGTGKTTCAKLYGRLLKELGFLSNGDVVSRSASDFIGDVVGASQTKTVAILEGAKGKVLIIDEAYAFDDSLYGKQVLDTLVEKIQGTPSDDIAVLLLGYEGKMIKMIEGQNPGLSRRFPKEHAFYFDDYDDNELLRILDLNLKRQEVAATFPFREKALEVLRGQRLQSGFGNAGSVETTVKGAMLKAAKRSSSPSVILDDIDIQDPGTARGEKDCDPLSQLDNLYRMDKVKNKLNSMKKTWAVERREGGEDPDLGHFVFLGSPGTGKTTVARVIANILFSLSLKGSDKIVEKSALDLTAEYVGQTTAKVNDALKEAKGGVLFIDEAYNIGNGPFGKEACDTLVSAMTSKEFCDVLIVIAGYPSETHSMLNANAGLKSRFTNFFEFPDWEPEDCVAFFRMCAGNDGFEIDGIVVATLLEGCSRLMQLKGWANGRDVNKLWTESKAQRAERVYDEAELEKKILSSDLKLALAAMVQARIGKLSDFDPNADPLAKLDNLFRMESIKAKIEQLKKTWAVAKREGSGAPSLGHFVFTGSPGTGKTTVARAIASVLFGLELKPSDKIIERSALDLTADYVGQTTTKVNEALQDAKGGVLFIDEAYNLGNGHFGKEACDTIVAAMTSDEYRDVQIVIAGYPAEIKEMLRTNAGLQSRFSHFFDFPDWTPDDCTSFFKMNADKEGFALIDASTMLDSMRAGCAKLIDWDGWANGRDVKRLFDDAKSHRAVRVYDHPEQEKTLVLSDVSDAISNMIVSRRPTVNASQESSSRNQMPLQFGPDSRHTTTRDASNRTMTTVPPVRDATNVATSAPTAPTGVATATAADKATRQEEQEEAHQEVAEEATEAHSGPDTDTDSNLSTAGNEGNEGDGRDDGVPDEIWQELEIAKARYQEQLNDLERAQQDIAESARREEEARLHHEAELERIRKELEREEQERARKEAEEREARRLHEAELRRKRLEEQQRKIEEEIRRQEEMQRRLQQLRPCPMGFNWFNCGSGWRCGGGSHYVTNEELHQRFGVDL